MFSLHPFGFEPKAGLSAKETSAIMIVKTKNKTKLRKTYYKKKILRLE